MKRVWQVLNILSVVFALVMNYLVGAQVLNVPSIKEASDAYATFLTPAAYAFSIWSVIYILLIVFAIYQARDLLGPRSQNVLPKRVGPYFVLANIGNGLWTYFFVSDFIGLSVFIILSMLALLFLLLYRLDIAVFNAPVRTILCVWWPLMLYAGWVLVAAVVNIASWLASLSISLSQFAAMAVLIVLCAALLIILYMRNVRELVLASTWGVIAVGVQQAQTNESLVVTTSAFTVGAVLLLATAMHAYQNRSSNLFAQIKKN